MRHHLIFFALLCVACGSPGSTNDGSGPPHEPKELTTAEVVLVSELDGFGAPITSGDVDGDGHPDLLLRASRNGQPAVVVVGGPLRKAGEQPLEEVATARLTADLDGGALASRLVVVGDTNGNGSDDVLLQTNISCTVPEGCYEDCHSTCSGTENRIYLVDGGALVDEVALGDLLASGQAVATPIDMQEELERNELAPMGDLNGDGLADYAISARAMNDWAGRIYIVFGSAEATSIDLKAVASGEGGYILEPEGDSNSFGRVVASADVNGDGRADLIVGAPYEDEGRGRAYVFFGKTDGSSVSGTDLVAGEGGFILQGEDDVGPVVAGGETGLAVAGGGDVNDDGLDDLLVSAPFLGSDDTLHSGRTYVVFGKSDGAPVNLATVADDEAGYVIVGNKFDKIGSDAAATSADLDGDGVADWLIDDSDANTYLVSGAPVSPILGTGDLAPLSLQTEGRWFLNRGSVLGRFNDNEAADMAFFTPYWGPEGDRSAILVVLR